MEDENYKEPITFYCPQMLEKCIKVTDKQLLWELIKKGTTFYNYKYSKQKRRKLNDKETSLQNKLQDLDNRICNTDFLDKEILDSYEAAEEELKRIHKTRGNEAMFRSKMKWIDKVKTRPNISLT